MHPELKALWVPVMLYVDMGKMMPELRLMLEAMIMAHAVGQDDAAVGWIALDVAQWMTELAERELADTLSAHELRKIHALHQVIASVSEALVPAANASA